MRPRPLAQQSKILNRIRGYELLNHASGFGETSGTKLSINENISSPKNDTKYIHAATTKLAAAAVTH